MFYSFDSDASLCAEGDYLGGGEDREFSRFNSWQLMRFVFRHAGR